MIKNQDIIAQYYDALIARDSQYDGLFFVGVKTTGVFCHVICPARKPKFENCEFFNTAQEALLAGFRPCKRCHPLSHPSQTTDIVKILVDAVEANPEKRWKDADFDTLSIHAITARRQFKKRFNMTFVEYARARRLGIAMQQIRSGKTVLDSQYDIGYESSSGFRDAFSKIMGELPKNSKHFQTLSAHYIDTQLGAMLIIADDVALYLLEFVDRRGLELEIDRLRKRTKFPITPGKTNITTLVEEQLRDYFLGKRCSFTIPLAYIGSDFQKSVWDALRAIPSGTTLSYKGLASSLGRPTAYRAVANANGANQIAIIVPCHRIINENGELGGYGGGLERKRWLIEHEAKMNKSSQHD